MLRAADVRAAIEQLQRVLDAIDAGQVEAQPAEHSFLLGAVASLRETVVSRKMGA